MDKLFYPQIPLIRNRMSNYLNYNNIPHGINAIIAIGCLADIIRKIV